MKKDVIYVRPSTLHKFVFCPRQVFFDYYLREKRPLVQRLRMLIGKILHWIHHLLKRGYINEELNSVEVDEIEGVVLVGKPDSYRVEGDTVILEEFKSSRIPRKANRYDVLAWEPDMIQACAYAYMLKKKYGRSVFVIIRYLDGATTFEYNDFMESCLLSVLEKYKKMVEGKILYDVHRTRKCNKCIYRNLCDKIDMEAKKVIEHGNGFG